MLHLTPLTHARRKLLANVLPILITPTPSSHLPQNRLSNPQQARHNSSSPSSSSSSSTPPKPPPPTPKTIFSGIQPTGTPHLGNYLGALQNWVKLQSESRKGDRLLFSIVDLHAITMPQETGRLREFTREGVVCLLALGLGGEGGGNGDGGGESAVFVQSAVQAHTELMWILSCTASMGYLSRMTQWKSKLSLSDDASPLNESSKSKLKLGLFSYPVLQAADILVHRATHVPVGEDQSQHLEFARECVTNFNHAYGPCLTYPETILSPAKRVMSLTDPLSKMSKSNPNPASRILITDPPSSIEKKIMAAVTDSQNSVSWDPVQRPGVSNLLTLLSAFSPDGKTPEELGKVYEGKGVGLGAFKKLVGESVSEGLEPVRRRYEEVRGEGEAFLDEVEEKGARVARLSAEMTMVDVRKAVGLSR